MANTLLVALWALFLVVPLLPAVLREDILKGYEQNFFWKQLIYNSNLNIEHYALSVSITLKTSSSVTLPWLC